MTRKQRLLNALFEIEQQLDALVVELENLTIKKKAQAKSAETVALYNWINTEFFTLSDDLSDYAYTSYSKGISTLRRIIEYAELKEPVKVVHQLNAEREAFESFLEKSEFEKVKGFYVQCPVCGTQVGKEAYKCSCGHHFREYEWVAEFTKPDGSIERYIRSEYGMSYELVKGGVTRPAEWVLTPIENKVEPQNGGDTNG